MNYIRHQQTVFAMMDANANIKPIHISLYLALFRKWNQNKFENPIIINRQEIMKMSKISSPNTYTKVLKELERWNYIRYHPSFDPNSGSKVHLYKFDTGTCTLPVSNLISSYKHINYIHNIYSSGESSQNELKENNMKEKRKKAFQVPPIEHIQIYFEQKGHSKTEAEKFFNYYESIGWLVGGKTKMKDWKAAARNWMLNVEKFQKKEANPKSKQETIKDQVSQPFSGSGYNEPL
ncbi:hypothetical protein [Plebeiibacterium sediminum]|uniref:Uncharacterized protein n=1 Tax=Plebeiibacterium sediminum TaxID=2992112 RepID=A0AAE3M713_9BACT|nr:hypothetical protein [Plebeiobacterium sediminum]MCW3788212.1 hypothetical protein [Plebeiobacterium sediminum]